MRTKMVDIKGAKAQLRSMTYAIDAGLTFGTMTASDAISHLSEAVKALGVVGLVEAQRHRDAEARIEALKARQVAGLKALDGTALDAVAAAGLVDRADVDRERARRQEYVRSRLTPVPTPPLPPGHRYMTLAGPVDLDAKLVAARSELRKALDVLARAEGDHRRQRAQAEVDYWERLVAQTRARIEQWDREQTPATA